MRLVDADAFKAEGRELYKQAGWDLRDVHYSQMDVECNIDMMPTIEAEPVKYGHMPELRSDYGRGGIMKVVDIIEKLEAQIEQLREKYCAECQEWSCENCWARIDEVEE